MPKELEIFIDGASKGNPGPSGIGVIICHNGEVIRNISNFIGNATNNIAEYTALIYALEEALLLKAENIKINTDSQLLARQLNKIYKIKNPHIFTLYQQVLRMLDSFKKVDICEIPRQQNKGADKLATQAIKKFFDKKAGRRQSLPGCTPERGKSGLQRKA